MEKQRRLPAVERNISEIRPEDYRVRILGTVVDRDEVTNSAMIDDGTGRIIAYFPTGEDFSLAKEGRLVRVLGKIRKGENIEMDVEIIQDMEKLDIGLYEQVKYVSEKLR
jgi:RPA family protein